MADNPNVTTRPKATVRTVTYFSAYVDVFTPSPNQGAYCSSVDCEHQHATEEAATRCARRLARAIRRDPAKFNLSVDARPCTCPTETRGSSPVYTGVDPDCPLHDADECRRDLERYAR